MVYQFLIFLSNVFVAVFGIQYDVVIVGAGLSGLGEKLVVAGSTII